MPTASTSQPTASAPLLIAATSRNPTASRAEMAHAASPTSGDPGQVGQRVHEALGGHRLGGLRHQCLGLGHGSAPLAGDPPVAGHDHADPGSLGHHVAATTHVRSEEHTSEL